jgi:predicted dehydrogenase
VYPIDQAVDAYNAIATGKEKGVGVLFQYEEQPIMARRITTNTAPAAAVGSEVRLSVIGAGNYASSMLLPHLAGNPKVHLVEVVTTTPLSAANAHRRFGFDRFGTDVEAALADPEVDAFLVATRHDSHAELVCQALSRGKAVFVEKPLAVNVSQLQEIVGTIESSRNDRVMVGFNRRFAPLLNHLRNEWQDSGPVHFRFDVNAGRLAERSWYADPQHGSRLVGEGGHFIDTASWWIGADPVEAFAVSLPNDRDNAAFSVRYSDGSVASISYFTDGHARYPKETIQIFGQGRTARFDNFRTYELWTGTRSSRRRSAKVDKGQKTQLDRFIDSIEEGLPMPIAVETLLLTTAASLAAERSVGTGALCSVEAELTRAVAVDPSFEVGADLDSAQAPSDADR